MNLTTNHNILLVSDLEELTAANANHFKKEVKAKIEASTESVIIDCSTIKFIDSSGLGALISINKAAGECNASMKLKSPSPTTYQLLELTRLHRVLDIIN